MKECDQIKALPKVDPDPRYFAPKGHKHSWYPALYVWDGESTERMVHFCRTCPEIRGRVGA